LGGYQKSEDDIAVLMLFCGSTGNPKAGRSHTTRFYTPVIDKRLWQTRVTGEKNKLTDLML
jgi:hypothetical protein